MPAPLPPDEEARLQAIAQYEVFDTEPEPAFDRVTGLAARIFNVPVSLISLVGRERQWLKSHHGIDVCETRREISFCAHAILLPPEAGVFVVPDATQDPRFASNPLVTGPLGVRFYAGAPLRTPTGLTVGSLCLIDTRPREFSEQDRATLTDLAASVVEILELRLVTARKEQESAERRWMETALRQSERRFRRMAANTPGMVYQFVRNADGSFHFPFVSDGCQELFGVDAQSIYDRPESVFEAIEPSDRVACLAEIKRSAETLGPLQWEGRLLNPDGTVRWVESKSRPEALDEGKVLWSGLLFDITARKRAQFELEHGHHLLRAIIDGTEDTVFIKDTESRYLLINPAGAALLGTTPEAVAGKTDDAFFSPENAAEIRLVDRDILASGRARTFQSTDLIAGTEHVFLSTKSPYRDGAGKLLGVIGVVREITEQRRADKALRAAKEEAEKANRAKSEFLSRMSHELRTPLNAILGFGQLLELGIQDAPDALSVRSILKAGRHLLTLVDEVLDLARVESGELHLVPGNVDVHLLAKECVALVARMARAREITCKIKLPGRRHLMVWADAQRLRQTLLNFLSNAIKYNRAGGQVLLNGERMPSGRLRLKVSDTGPGISPEGLARLFVPFERLDQGRNGVEGTGLGLVVSRRIVEAMGGSVGVESRPGHGSVFWIELPLGGFQRPPSPRAAARVLKMGQAPVALARATVLYIEDDVSNQEIVKLLLASQRPGWRFLAARDGAKGLVQARKNSPDVILLDLQMPGISGDAVLAELNRDPATQAIPVIMLTADATSDSRRRLLASGAAGYLSKPFELGRLLALLDEVLRPR